MSGIPDRWRSLHCRKAAEDRIRLTGARVFFERPRRDAGAFRVSSRMPELGISELVLRSMGTSVDARASAGASVIPGPDPGRTRTRSAITPDASDQELVGHPPLPLFFTQVPAQVLLVRGQDARDISGGAYAGFDHGGGHWLDRVARAWTHAPEWGWTLALFRDAAEQQISSTSRRVSRRGPCG